MGLPLQREMEREDGQEKYAMYEYLLEIDNPTDPSSATLLKRLPPNRSALDEDSLQNLLFHFPQALPLAAIDGAYAGAVPICQELSLPAGALDALYVNQLGRLTLAEFKLWRNPQARREVIGQILNYAKDLASWRYEDLQRQVSQKLGKKGNVLYDRVRERHPELDEAAFCDNVSRHLRRGEFLLLIVGDGIREDARNIVDFVQRHSGLHFNLALVEAALYSNGPGRLLVQPRILAKTEIVARTVIADDHDRASGPEDDEAAPLSSQEEENLRFWNVVTADFTFSDVAMEPPATTKGPILYIQVRKSGRGDWGLQFTATIIRRTSHTGSYLTCRKNIQPAGRIYDDLVQEFDELRAELGDDLETWEDANGRPRLGFRRQGSLDFLSADSEDEAFKEAVAWMQDRLDRLVSTLHPRLQRMIATHA